MVEQSGRILSIEPDGDAIEYTHFDCWSPTGDETSMQYEWEDSGAIQIAENLFRGLEERLKVSFLPDYSFEMWWLSLGWEYAFQVAAYHIAKAGYDVYLSDTRFEIYAKRDASKDEGLIRQVEDVILEVANLYNEVTTSDLQGIATVKAKHIIKQVAAAVEVRDE